jgi:hypothetical protein
MAPGGNQVGRDRGLMRTRHGSPSSVGKPIAGTPEDFGKVIAAETEK